jgi:hypothetical protein
VNAALTFRKANFMWFDLLEAWGLAGLALLGAYRFSYWDDLVAALNEHHSDFYGALASVIGSLLGFTITAAAVLLSFASTPELEVVRGNARYADLWQTFLAAIRWLGIGTAFSLVAIMVTPSGVYRDVELVLAAGVVSGCTARFVRCVWVFEKVIWLVVRPKAS